MMVKTKRKAIGNQIFLCVVEKGKKKSVSGETGWVGV